MTKPLVKLFGLGGTIAGRGSDRMDYTNYPEGDDRLAVADLLQRIPEVQEVAEVSVTQPFNLSSRNIGPTEWLAITQAVNRTFEDEPETAGVVLTHGTATLEETAFFLNLTVKSPKPVILTGAMRPPTSLGTDADANLLDAIRLAASPEAKDQGVLVLLNNEIQAARDVTKTDAHRLETFQSPHVGLLGYVDADQSVTFYRKITRRHTHKTEFDVNGCVQLPRVDIALAYAGADGRAIEALVRGGAQGIVSAGLGSGNAPDAFQDALLEARRAGVVIVEASGAASGRVTITHQRREAGVVVADNLRPKKARILLTCALTITHDVERIQTMFDVY